MNYSLGTCVQHTTEIKVHLFFNTLIFVNIKGTLFGLSGSLSSALTSCWSKISSSCSFHPWTPQVSLQTSDHHNLQQKCACEQTHLWNWWLTSADLSEEDQVRDFSRTFGNLNLFLSVSFLSSSSSPTWSRFWSRFWSGSLLENSIFRDFLSELFFAILTEGVQNLLSWSEPADSCSLLTCARRAAPAWRHALLLRSRTRARLDRTLRFCWVLSGVGRNQDVKVMTASNRVDDWNI